MLIQLALAKKLTPLLQSSHARVVRALKVPVWWRFRAVVALKLRDLNS